MFVEISRLLIVLTFTLTGLALGSTLGGVLGTLAGYVMGGITGRQLDRAFGVIANRVDRVEGPKLFAAAMGALVGGLAAAFVAVPVVVIVPHPPVVIAATLLVWSFGSLGLRIGVRKTDELFAMAGLSTRPLVRSAPFEADDGYIVDTSAVMDGQMSNLVKSGVIDQALFLPRFVLDELQGFADAREGAQARRARRGLEMLDALRRDGRARIRILDDEVPEIETVDAKLVALGRRLQLRLLTCDVHLQRVAEIQGVPVLNLRRLADDLRPERSAGDIVTVELVRRGKEAGQAVGYLDDGSMVVVNDADHQVGNVIEVEITSIIPTAVGRLLFARIPTQSNTPANA